MQVSAFGGFTLGPLGIKKQKNKTLQKITFGQSKAKYEWQLAIGLVRLLTVFPVSSLPPPVTVPCHPHPCVWLDPVVYGFLHLEQTICKHAGMRG